MKSCDENIGDTPESRLLAAEGRFSFIQQIGRADSEARAQVAERTLCTIIYINAVVFAFIAAAMTIDQYNVLHGYYNIPIVSGRLLGGLIAGIVTESIALSLCFGRIPSRNKQTDK